MTPIANPLVNPVKARMQSGSVALGMNVRLARSGDIVRIAKSSGHDFIFIDTQHSIFDVETIAHIAQTALDCGVAALVRVRGIDDPDTSLLLDNGVAGIVFPDVNTPEEAHRAVEICKFPPIGARSVGGGYPHFDFRAVPIKEAIPQLNAVTLVVCMIETRAGLDNIEAIAGVPGIDVIHIGSNDLLTALGKPGQFDDAELVSALDRAVAAAAKHGKFAGCGGNRDIERQARAVRQGVRFLTTQTDLNFLVSAATRWTSDLRRALAGATT